MQEIEVSYELPAVMRAEECYALHSFLTSNANNLIKLDASAVEKIGGQTAQMLAFHCMTASSRFGPKMIHNPSTAMVAVFSALDLLDVLEGET